VFSAHNPQILQLITAPNKNGCYKHLFLIQKFSQAATSVSCKTLPASGGGVIYIFDYISDFFASMFFY